jgi:fructose-specific PTS system IIA-like component
LSSSAQRSELQRRQRASTDRTLSELQQASLALLTDRTLSAMLRELIEQGGRTACQAVVEALGSFSKRLEHSESAYLRERVADLEEIGVELVRRINGGEPELYLSTPSVICAPRIGPGQLLSVPRELLAALVLEDAGTTSHAVILARSLGIPVVAGASYGSRLQAGATAVVDGRRGIVIQPVTEAVLRCYQRERAALERRAARLGTLAARPAATEDGRRIEVAANVASRDGAAAAVSSGAEGIGLLRTEMLFAQRITPPTEEEQFLIYTQIMGRDAGTERDHSHSGCGR